MRLSWVPLAVSALALAGLALRSAATDEGKKIDYRFSTPPVNAAGIKSLADLRGKPVLIDFWGTR